MAEFTAAENKVKSFTTDEFTYDYLVVCPGIQLDWNKIKGRKDTLGKYNVSSNYSFQHAPYTRQMIKNFQRGTAVFTNSITPMKCGGEPHKIMYLACNYWRKKGILDNFDVDYISVASEIFSVKEYAETLKELISKYNIHVHYGANVTAVDGENKTIDFESKENDENLNEKLSSKNAGSFEITQDRAQEELKKITLKFDLCHAVPPQ